MVNYIYMYEPFLTFPRIALFHDTRSSHAQFMHKLSFFTCQCHDQNHSHQKVERFHQIIQIKLDSFPLKQKSDKIEDSLVPPM